MKALIVMLGLVFTAGFIQQVVGIACDTLCAACWKTGSPGVDIKFSCKTHENHYQDCGGICPSGYENIHCAKVEDCYCPVRSQPCQKFGPCAYGMFTEIVGSGDTWCKTPWGRP